ncbi:hypothetical protein M0813_16074 [Anaeramoeba flamelloides]|uniref:Uncharacterized protein n=1 Tax=Anaeramoeba flamelloides TaxID=1746091 RepID=A0ABQ8Z0Y1_9EUKA|nr:hypothetical protein M0813_16074 [Anaeramoeba flamelloides]
MYATINSSKLERTQSWKDSMNLQLKRQEKRLMEVFLELRETKKQNSKYQKKIKQLKKKKYTNNNKEDWTLTKRGRSKIKYALEETENSLSLCEKHNLKLKKKIDNLKESNRIEIKEMKQNIEKLEKSISQNETQSEREKELEIEINEYEEKNKFFNHKKKEFQDIIKKQKLEIEELKNKLTNSGKFLRSESSENSGLVDANDLKSLQNLQIEKDQKIETLTFEIKEFRKEISELLENQNDLEQSWKLVHNKTNQEKKELEVLLEKQKKNQFNMEKNFEKEREVLQQIIKEQKIQIKNSSLNNNYQDNNSNDDENTNNNNNNNNSNNSNNNNNNNANIQKLKLEIVELKNEKTKLEKKNRNMEKVIELNNQKQKEYQTKIEQFTLKSELYNKVASSELNEYKEKLIQHESQIGVLKEQLQENNIRRGSETRVYETKNKEKDREIENLKDQITEIVNNNNIKENKFLQKIQDLTNELEKNKTIIRQKKNQWSSTNRQIEDLESNLKLDIQKINEKVNIIVNMTNNSKQLRKWKGLKDLQEFTEKIQINLDYNHQQLALRQKENDYKLLSGMMNNHIQEKTILKKGIKMREKNIEKLQESITKLQDRLTLLKKKNTKLQKQIQKQSNPRNENNKQYSKKEDLLKIKELTNSLREKNLQLKEYMKISERAKQIKKITSEASLNNFSQKELLLKLTNSLSNSKIKIKDLQEELENVSKMNNQNTNNNINDFFDINDIDHSNNPLIQKYLNDQQAFIFELDQIDSLLF